MKEWLNTLLYRLTVSNKELNQARNEAKILHVIRQKLRAVQTNFQTLESKGISCKEGSGNYVPLKILGYRLFACEEHSKNDDLHQSSNVVDLHSFRQSKCSHELFGKIYHEGKK